MKTFVISLKDSPRRQRMTEQLNRLGLDFQFFDAVNGKELVNPYQDKNYCKTFRKLFFDRDLTVGEIGCYQSHCAVWSYAILYNQPILILEDDILVSEQLPVFLNQIEAETSNDDFDLLRAGGTIKRKVYRANIKGIELYRYFKYPVGAQGYIVTPDGARKLLFYSRKMKLPIDEFMDSSEFLYGVKTYCVQPYLVFNNDSVPENKSCIGERGIGQKSKKIHVRLLKGILNKYFSVRKFLYTRFHYLKSLISQGDSFCSIKM